MKKIEINKHKKQDLEKIVVSSGIGRLRQNNAQFDEKILPEISSEIGLIAGQQPRVTRARKSIAGFKLRQGDIVGLRVTLRRRRMRDFLSRLVNAVLPRVRDFRGIKLSNIDRKGNLNIGIRDQFVFPEIDPEVSKTSFGLQITLVPKHKNREEAIDFYRQKGVPLEITEKKR